MDNLHISSIYIFFDGYILAKLHVRIYGILEDRWNLYTMIYLISHLNHVEQTEVSHNFRPIFIVVLFSVAIALEFSRLC